MQNQHKPFERLFLFSILFSLALIALGVILGGPATILPGLRAIIVSPDLLITDYVALVGFGPAMVNAGLVSIISMVIIKLTGEPLNGFTLVEIGLMAGFALFGKNIANIWPILLGSWLYARYQREPYGKYAGVGLLATCLAPLVSYAAALGNHRVGFPAGLPIGLLVGVFIGFVLPPLSAYTYKLQNGMNLYNMGFACGLFALVMVPILTGFGLRPDSALYWAEDHNLTFGIIIGALCLFLVVGGFFLTGVPAGEVWTGYRKLLSTTGRAPSDYLNMFGPGPVMVNMGVNGVIAAAYILVTGGQLNGPTVGGVLTIMGFSAFGKHARNILPVMTGIYLGGYLMEQQITYPSLQLAALFGTTLAPLSGHFGWPVGLLAGFIHSAVVLQAGSAAAGLNLYNNGFCGGLISIILHPVLSAIIRHHSSLLRNRDYYALFKDTPGDKDGDPPPPENADADAP